MSSKKFLKIVFGLSLLGILFVGGVNYVVDSLGLIRESIPDKVAKDLSDGKIIAGLSDLDERIFRKKQIEYLKNNIQYVAIGSSRTMQLRKNMFLNDGINNFQNYSVSGASLEDYIALLQIHKNKFGKFPTNIILGTDPWIFNKASGQTRYISLKEEYEEFLYILDIELKSNYIKKNKLSYLFSFDYLKQNLKVIKKDKQYYIVDNIYIDDILKMPDGSIYYPYEHRYPDFNKVKKQAENYAKGTVYSLGNFKEIHNKKLFEKFITYLQNSGSTIYLYLPPYNPITYDIVIKQENYKIIEKTEQYLINFAKEKDIKLVGSYNPHNYNLNNEHFFDGMHSLDTAYEIIFKELLEKQ